MLDVTAALSVSEQIKDAGAYAGLASILGLAVLSLLYFGQARELRRLRDWAGRAPERTAELQEQANAAAGAAPQRRVVAQPGSTAAPAARPGVQAPATAAGAAAAAGAKPAQAVTAAGAARPATAAGAAQPATAGQPAGAAGAATAAGAAGAATAAGAAQPATAAGSVAVPGSTAVPEGGQETQAIPPVPAPLPPATPSVAASTPMGPDAPPTDDNPVPLRQVSGAPRPRRTTPEVWPPEDQDAGPDRKRLLGIGGGIAGGLVVLVLLIVLFSGGDDEPTRTTAGQTTSSPENTIETPSTPTTSTPPITPGDYQVFVLNGTTQNGIAAEFAQTLESDGYRTAGTGNATVNTAPTTQVFFNEGNKRAATAIARKLRVKTANVKAAGQDIAVQGPGADVIVQIGADKVPGASGATTGTTP